MASSTRTPHGGRGSNQYQTRGTPVPAVRDESDLDPETVIAAFDPDLQVWIASGFTAAQIQRWQDEGIELSEALTFQWAGYPTEESVPKIAGFHVVAGNLIEWKARHPFDVYDPLIRAGFHTECSAAPWIERPDIPVVEAARWAAKGLTVFEYEHHDPPLSDHELSQRKRRIWSTWEHEPVDHIWRLRARGAGITDPSVGRQWQDTIDAAVRSLNMSRELFNIRRYVNAGVDRGTIAEVVGSNLSNNAKVGAVKNPELIHAVFTHPAGPAAWEREHIEAFGPFVADDTGSGFDWCAAGQTPEAMHAWRNVGIRDPDEADGLTRLGFTPETFEPWTWVSHPPDAAVYQDRWGNPDTPRRLAEAGVL